MGEQRATAVARPALRARRGGELGRVVAAHGGVLAKSKKGSEEGVEEAGGGESGVSSSRTQWSALAWANASGFWPGSEVHDRSARSWSSTFVSSGLSWIGTHGEQSRTTHLHRTALYRTIP